jgi:hypothetical protein
MKKFAAVAASVLAFPFSASAQLTTELKNANDILSFIKSALNVALPLIIAAAVVWFVWSMFQYFVRGDEEQKAAAKTQVLYSIIGIFFMVSVWGLVNILYNTFNLDRNNHSGEVVNQLPQNLGGR